MQWYAGSPHGIQRSWRFYCRLAIEGLPQQSWSIDSAQQVVAGKVIVDRLEQQSIDKTNTSACFAWGWAWNPDAIPTSNTFSIIDRLEFSGARAAWADGVPPVPERRGPTYPVLIHLDISKESAGPNGVVSPPVRHPWALGTEDVRSRLPQGPRGGAHERLLPRRRDDDADDGDARRKPRGRRSFRSTLLGCDIPEGSTQAPARRNRGQRGGNGGGGGRRRDDAVRCDVAPAPVDATATPVTGCDDLLVVPASTPVSADPAASAGVPVWPLPCEIPLSGRSGYDAVLFQEPEDVQFSFDAEHCWSELTRTDPMLLEDAISSLPRVLPAPVVDWPLLQHGSLGELQELTFPPLAPSAPVATTA
ncbi:hypothetical protein ACQ4PT_042445 [Festuca glaucescens]